MERYESGMEKIEERKRDWIQPSTRAFLRAARQTEGFTIFDFLHGYVYGRWPYLYIGVGTGEHPLTWFLRPLVRMIDFLRPSKVKPSESSKTFADTYHGKVVTPVAARQLVMVNEDISLRDLEPIIPYAMARDIVLKNPDHIVTLECPCRASRSEPCSPLDVCLIIGEPFASFVFEHHPRRSRWISSQEATEILEAEHERGHVHHAFFKDAMFGRFYAICNCCPCCCGAMHAWRRGTPMLTSSGFISHLDERLCNGCGTCVDVCPFGAISMLSGELELNPTACMGCGVCVSACEVEALSLIRDPQASEPLEIFRLIAQAASPDLSS